MSPPRSEVMNGRDGGKGDVGDLIVHEHSCTIYRKGDRSRTSNHWLKQMASSDYLEQLVSYDNIT